MMKMKGKKEAEGEKKKTARVAAVVSVSVAFAVVAGLGIWYTIRSMERRDREKQTRPPAGTFRPLSFCTFAPPCVPANLSQSEPYVVKDSAMAVALTKLLAAAPPKILGIDTGGRQLGAGGGASLAVVSEDVVGGVADIDPAFVKLYLSTIIELDPGAKDRLFCQISFRDDQTALAPALVMSVALKSAPFACAASDMDQAQLPPFIKGMVTYIPASVCREGKTCSDFACGNNV